MDDRVVFADLHALSATDAQGDIDVCACGAADAGQNVAVQYSDKVPELTAEQQSSMEKLQALSNRTGNVVPSAKPKAGAEIGPESPRPGSLSAQTNMSALAPASFGIFRNQGVRSSTSTTTTFKKNFVMEPSTGAGGRRLFETGNWFAARSTDGGATWGYLNPYTIFNDATVKGFCCDQVTLYDPSRDVQFWLLQYGNGLKLALSRNSFTSWCYYNITPGTVGEPATTELDYNDLAIGTNDIYIATNYFTIDGGGSFILRYPIDPLLTCSGFGYNYVKWTSDFTFKPVQGASDVMYWASNWNDLARGSSIRIFSWAENSGSYNWYNETGLPAWSFQYRNDIQQCGSLSGTTVKNWCQFADSRVLGAALINGSPSPQLVFSFNANQDGGHPFPYTRLFYFRESDMAYLGQAELWATWAAFQFTSLSPNARGDLAMNSAFGGQAAGGTAYYPSNSVLIQDDYSPTQPWQRYDYLFGGGNTCTYGGLYRWGDYLTVRPYYPAGYAWIATGFAIKGANCGSTGWYSQWNSIVFGRGRDVNSYGRWRGH